MYSVLRMFASSHLRIRRAASLPTAYASCKGWRVTSRRGIGGRKAVRHGGNEHESVPKRQALLNVWKESVETAQVDFSTASFPVSCLGALMLESKEPSHWPLWAISQPSGLLAQFRRLKNGPIADV